MDYLERDEGYLGARVVRGTLMLMCSGDWCSVVRDAASVCETWERSATVYKYDSFEAFDARAHQCVVSFNVLLVFTVVAHVFYCSPHSDCLQKVTLEVMSVSFR